MENSGQAAAVEIPRRTSDQLIRWREKKRSGKISRPPLVAVSKTLHAPRLPLEPPPPPPPPRVINPKMMNLLFEKELTMSDVNDYNRILIPKRHAVKFFPRLQDKEGIWIHFGDMQRPLVWSLKFRYWLNDNTRLYVLLNTKGFITLNNLVIGDYIMVFQDKRDRSYALQARKRHAGVGVQNNNSNNVANATTSSVPQTSANAQQMMMMMMMNVDGSSPSSSMNDESLSFESLNRFFNGLSAELDFIRSWNRSNGV